MKKFLVIIFLVIIVFLMLYIFNNSEDKIKIYEEEKPRIENGEIVENIEEEKEVKEDKAQEIFRKVPKMYMEAISPFSEEFKLNAVMEKITEQSNLLEVEPDYSKENVDKVLKELFGKDTSLDNSMLTMDKIENSIYYYSKETNSYEILPVGFTGVYLDQKLIKVTQTSSRIYVYAYCLVGEYLVNDDGKINAVIGDKEGNDLELSFDSEIITDKWIEEYKDNIPVFRYTLEKENDSNYLIAVEQVN